MKSLSLFNLPIILSSLSLISIGILVIYSSSQELAIQQLLFTLVGILIFLFISSIEIKLLKGFMLPLYLITNLLLLLVLFLGIETRGSVRWIPLGIFNIQPSEFAKPVLILMLAQFWSKNIPTWKNIFKSFFWAFPFIFLVFKQPDLGSSLTLVAIWIGELFAARISFKKIFILALIILVTVPTSWLFLHDYQRQRITSFLSPEADPLGRGYNLIQSTIAVGSGQFFGRGLGRGTQSRLQFLPEFRTDFIFASIAEEMGFLGSLIILSLYLYLFIYCFMLALKINDLFDTLVILGVVSMLIFQFFVNTGMNLGLLPITGITLPLISYGGSSLIATLFSLGMVASTNNFKKRIDLD